MFQKRTRLRQLTLIGIGIMMAGGCNEDDARLAQLAEEASQRQAAQNQEVVRVNREVADAGPGGEMVVPVDVDYSQSFAASEKAAWEDEYQASVSASRNPGSELKSSGVHSTLPSRSTPRSLAECES